MTHLISPAFLPADSVSERADEPPMTVDAKAKTWLEKFSFARWTNWEPLCPDLVREVATGLGRRD